MGLRSEREYLESLRDGREVYMNGRRIADVTTEPSLRAPLRTGALDFALAEDPTHRDLASYAEETLNGERCSRFFQIPRGAGDLMARRNLIEFETTETLGVAPFMKEVGSDGMNALEIVAPKIDAKYGTEYHARQRAYRQHCRRNDLAVALAMSDTKGDRRADPHAQLDPDSYVRIVERRSDGIVVRGAKVHITNSPIVNEIIAMPTKNMKPADADYAVAFATPVNAPGLKLIVKPLADVSDNTFDHPITSRYNMAEAMVIYDDVFVPWDRVFLAGESEFAVEMVYAFATFQRFTGLSYKPAMADLFVGVSQLLAETNGVEKAPHIRDKITFLITYVETIRSMSAAAAMQCEMWGEVAVPNPVLTNMAKHFFATHYHECLRAVQDIAGAMVVTSPSDEDWQNKSTSGYLRKYFITKEGVDPRERMKLVKLARELSASDYAGHWAVTTLHGEGSPEAQKFMIYNGFDFARAKVRASRAAGLEDAGQGP